MTWTTEKTSQTNGGGLTGTSERKQHLDSLQQKLRAVPESLQSIQNHKVVLVLHKLHQVVVTH